MSLLHKDEESRTQVTSNSIAFSSDDALLLVAINEEALLWEVSTGRLLFTVKGHQKQVTRAVFSPDGRSVLTVSRDKTARLWRTQDGKLVAVLEGCPSVLRFGCFSPDGRQIAVGDEDGSIFLWEPPATKASQVIKDRGELGHLEFANDGSSQLISAADRFATVWDTRTGTQQSSLEGHENGILEASLLPDGRTVLTTSLDGTARIWNSTTGAGLALLLPEAPPDTAVVQEDGRTLVSGRGQQPIWATSHSRDGRRIALGHDSRVSIWRKKRPEAWWGIGCRASAWLVLVLAVGLAVSLVYDRRRLQAGTKDQA